jgi:hypothetical protein
MNNLIQSMYALGQRMTNKKPVEFNAFLKENVKDVRQKLKQYKPVFDVIRSAVSHFV